MNERITCKCGVYCQDIGGGRCRYEGTPDMAKLTDLPIVPAPDGGRRFAEDVRKGVQAEGAASRAAGLPIARCPPFVDPDMAADWQIGWSYEDSILSGRRDRKTGLLKD